MNAPWPAHAPSTFSVEEVNKFAKFLKEQDVGRWPGGISLDKGIKKYAEQTGIDPKTLRKLWTNEPEWEGLRKSVRFVEGLAKASARANRGNK